jgi:predicted PurR-regulated permease PerM
MKKPEPQSDWPISRIMEVIITVALVIGLIAWCFIILAPFLNIIIWGIIMAIALHPSHLRLSKKLGNRRKWAAVLITLILLAAIIVPGFLLADSLVDKLRDLSQDFSMEELRIAPPPEKVADWPVIGNSIYQFWSSASTGLENLVKKYEPQLIKASAWLFSTVVETGFGLVQFLLSIILSGILLASAGAFSEMGQRIFQRVAGERGPEFSSIAEQTIRNVTRGILGVAIIQALLAGLGFLLAGIPGAGLWTLLALIFAVVQIGVGPVAIPVIIYMFYSMSPVAAILFTIYFILVMLSDNILKPIILGKGSPVPMLVVFLGAIGGFIASGFLGLFTGAVILSVGYKLFQLWIDDGNP